MIAMSLAARGVSREIWLIYAVSPRIFLFLTARS